MKKITLVLVVICTIQLGYAQQWFIVDTAKSIINWEGADLLNVNTHNGTVKFKTGTIRTNSTVFNKSTNAIAGGEFEIDMNSIINTDGKYNEGLVSHLKNEDFFNVKKHPIARLEIINVDYVTATDLDVVAYLTINGIRQLIKYKSTIENSKNQILMKSKFEIDRTLWKINYKSKNFIVNLKDDIISNTINFEVVVVTNPDGC